MPRRKKDTGPANAGETAAPAERLTPVTENYLLCLYKLWEDSLIPTLTQLTDTIRQLPASEGLGTSVPSVAGMIRRMRRQALVDVGPDKRIRLTKKGHEGAENIARRHRLAEWLVVRLLGMDLHKAHTEAHRLEHVMSREFEEKLAERLGYPKRCPFGRPIPGSGEPRIPVDSLTLDSASVGVTYMVERVPEEDSELLYFLIRSSIIPDHEITVVEAAQFLGVLMVATQEEKVSIGYNVARQILVRAPETA
ncbi:MAG: metal-dependent transcriptional regulator [Dehalococcoidia bacterium]|jgi:DtxR family Mn-dependent transcriptional regulator|nr:metal-dependent transcriptional regulator [Dehalococcoidia bacterium]MDP6227047.1 metal-dependent transcriptional regulator [Dehalococcoidia bacterium]MDP7083608.1 metal-dependent transcriptional regulator [Dehalococcoidia bacterium]MDP7199575.1 metal-dependent transcriptional regulator [Dehalococcoidia bacterium]MDP7511636.1 metal-dependent transcriptional regulator [Dehalococcoidia bacterium]